MRCLNFGHGTRNCNLKPSCNFCLQEHCTENCVLEGAREFRCANSSGQHMSTDKRCPNLEEYQRIRKQTTTRNQPNQQKKKKQNIINLDEFPELPPPMSSFGWQRSGSPPRAPPGGNPPGSGGAIRIVAQN
ncbi:AAEL005758-PA [Aedes aegypti]|uniref:AAEL005758-PA n=1 Tax=Aedes aegypti TaxID=7159 RepID=Q178V6_AEDAE|nr:AAEL005758-PA [Aedes aegypti]